jgi:surface antigen
MKKVVVIFFVFVFMPFQFTKAVDFGIQVGQFNGCVAYSNGSTTYYSGLPNYAAGVYTGIKWQCVEYVQRYYYEQYGLNIKPFFGNANSFFNQGNASAAGLQIYPNGGYESPQVGDILCSNGGTYGHVAIVREVTTNYIKVIQQNWLNHSGDNSFTLTRNGNTVNGFNSSYQINGWLRNPTITPSCTFKVSVSGGSSQQLSQGWKFWQIANPSFYQVSGNISNLPVGWAYAIYLADENGISIAPIITNQTASSFNFGFQAGPPHNDGSKYKFIFVPNGNPASPWQVSPYFYMSQLPTLNIGSVPNLCSGNNYAITWSVNGGIPTLPNGGWEGNIQLQWYQNGSPKPTIAFTPVNNNSLTITVPASISGATIPGSNFQISGSNPSGTSMPEGFVSDFSNYFSINSQPVQPGPISGTQNPCSGDQTTYSILPVSGATSYTWEYSGGGTPSGTGTSCSLIPTSSGTLKVKANNNCGSSPERTLALTITSQPQQPGPISGLSDVIAGNSYDYSVTSIQGVDSYSWSFSGNGTVIENDNTCTLTPFTSGNLTVTVENQCGSNTSEPFSISISTFLPEVVTLQPNTITSISAVVGGNVIEEGSSDVFERGVYWGINNNPELTGIKIQIGSGQGQYTTTLNELYPGTTYYVKAYANNNDGTGYGEELSFTTLNEVLLPTLITQNAIDISENSATSGGSVIDDGGAEVTARGVVWSTSGEPSLEINEGLTQDGAGMGDYISYLTGLSAGTTYHVRAYATNSEGTAYGNEVTFTTLSSETYFNAVWTTPFNPMTFYIVGANIDEVTMQAGSEIGLFDIDPITGQEICVGAGVLVEPLVGGVHLEMIASMNDGSNPEQANGFTPGNPIIYKLWNNEIGEVSNVIANYPFPGYDESYTALGSTFVKLSGLTFINQQVSLQEGWNLMSFRVMPENWDMLHIVQPLIDQGLLFKVLDETGGSVFHLPFPPPNGQWSNTIGDMANTEGYYIKVHDNAVLEIEGYPVELPLDIPLVNGWNMISYPCENEQDAMAVVQPLIDAGILFKVIDEAGGSIFHLPFPPPNGQWSNTIGNFKSDKGYYLKATSNATLTIGCDGEAYIGHIPGNAPSHKAEFFVPVWQNNPFMPMHVALMPSENMIAGDEIGIFDGDVCVGSIVFDGDYNLPLIITTSQHEPDNSSVNGFIIGNEISIRYYDISTGNVSPAEIEIIDGSGFFDSLGTLIGKLKATTTNVALTSADEFRTDIVPNPFFDKLYLALNLQEAGTISVECFNMLGQQVSLVHEIPLGKGMNRLALETAHLEAGAYLLKIIYHHGKTEQSNSFKVLKRN